MGWSCAVKAAWVTDAWSQACIKNSGSQNQWSYQGETYFFETSRIEHDDGAITGSIWKCLPDGVRARRSGTFRIEGNGKITRAPKWLREHSPSLGQIDKRYNETYGDRGTVQVV